MWTLILRFLLVLAGILLLRRVLEAVKGLSRGRKRPTEPPPSSRTVKDPVCGMYMDPRLAFQTVHQGKTYYFCSETCRKEFNRTHA